MTFREYVSLTPWVPRKWYGWLLVPITWPVFMLTICIFSLLDAVFLEDWER